MAIKHAKAGSSPHTRGAPVVLDAGVRDRRIIPAYAGSTFSAAESASTAWIIPAYAGSTEEETKDAGTKTDHPRIRGEHEP